MRASSDTSGTAAAILAVAISVLQDQGAHALTVRRVAAGAGCSTTGVYTHFGGKQGLVEAIFLDGFESLKLALAEATSSVEDLGRAYRTWARDRPTHYLVMFGRAVPEYQPSDEALRQAGLAFDVLVDVVANSIASPAPRPTAFHVWATFHGYVMLEMLGMFPKDLGTPDELYQAGLDHLLTMERQVPDVT